MNFSQLAYRKEQLYKVLIAFSLVLSLFSVAAPIALSNIQQKNTSTEFLWIRNNKMSGRSLEFSVKQILNTSFNYCIPIRRLSLETILNYNREQTVKFIHFTNVFKVIKTTIVIAFGFNNDLIISDQPDLI